MSELDPILAGDARLVLPNTLVPDILIVDPPYRAHVHKNAVSQDQHTDGNVRHNDLGFASLTEELRTWICQLAAKTRRWSLIYTDVESVAKWKDTLELAGATYIRTLPWVRWSMPALSGDRPPQGFECIVVAYGSNRGRKRWNGAGNLTHLAHTLDWSELDELHLNDLTHIAHLALRGKNKQKAEKPLDQLLDLVSWFSNRGVLDQGELVCDPCSGSGTTGLACKILGRNFIGCELDLEWAEKGNARIRSCNPGDLPGSLSSRDSERFLRWVTTSEKEKVDLVERKFNTERVRKRLEDKKLSLVPAPGVEQPRAIQVDVDVDLLFDTEERQAIEEEDPMIPNTWTQAYQECLTEVCAPLPASPEIDGARMQEWRKTSAAERTVPLFEDKWRDAYERVVTELTPSLSPALLARIAESRATATNGTKAEFRCPECIDEPERCQSCQDFYTKATWATAPVDPRAPRVASGEAIPNPYKFMPGGVAPAATPPPTEKRGKGRPPGVKNKMPKEWKQVHTRVMAELAPSS